MTAQLGQVGLSKLKGQSKEVFSQHSLFSPETELKAHQTAGLLPRQLGANPSTPFSLGGRKEEQEDLQKTGLSAFRRFEERGVGVAMESGARSGLEQILLPLPTGPSY